MEGTAGLMLLAVLSLCRCPQTTAASVHADDFPAIVDDFPGYFAELEKNKPINWTSTLNLLSTGQISPTCYSHAYTVHNDTTLAKSYAQFMLDSTGKLTPSGVFEGNWLDIGNYKECTTDANNAVDRPEGIQAMYCLVSWAKTPEAAELNLYDSDANYRQGVCVPKSCSDSEVQDLTETGFLGVKPMSSWLPVNVYCQREETYVTYSTGAIVALTVIAILLCVLAVSTSYELYITIWFPEEERKPFTTSRVGRFCLSCSVYSNTKKVFNTYQHPGQLPALHGIRVISALWIIYGHVYGFPPIDTANKVEKTEDGKQLWFLVIRGNYDMAVDTFLLLSGLLVTYLFMKQMKKTGGQFTWRDYGLHVLHRYFRLTPVLALLIMIFTCLIAYMGSGPWWAIRDNFTMDFVQNCEKYWWANLLYINNFVGQRCFTHGWYLGADMQLYVTLTGLLVVLYRYPKAGVAVACFLIGSSWLLNGILYHFLVNVNGESYSYTTYRWSFTRMAPYIIGILLGYLLFRTNRKVPDTPNTRGLMLLGWLVGTACALVAFFTPFGAPEANLLGHPAWKAFERSLFATGVAWVVYACCVGYGANKVEKTEDGKQLWFLVIRGNYDMAVDTFLLLSGLLVTYLFMKQMKKTGGQFTWRDYGLHVLHRYFRLTPVLALLIMIFTCLIAYMGSGPWWAIRDNFTMDFVQNCEKYWWANLLYINNFVGQRCFTHGWYLGADMQLYVTLTGLLVVLYRYPKAGVAVACFLIGSSWLLNGILYHFLVNVNGESYSYTTYRWSFTRMAPYIIGILLGYLLFRTNRKVPDTPNTRGLMLLGWLVGTACALVAFFTPFGAPEANLLGHPAWKAFERSLFATGVAWVVYACCVGYGANKVEKTEDGKQLWFLVIRGNYDMAVDTFLLLSGLLVTYLFMKQMKKTGGQFTWRDYGLHVLHRYFRLTPVLALLIMIFTCLIAYMGSGPWWAIRDNFTMDFVQNCEKYWWANLLYINNFVGQRCFTHGWYLGADMQLYVTLTGLLVVLYRYPKAGVAVACFLIGSSWLLNGILYHFLVNVNGESYSYTTYRWSFTRMAPYIIGILLGYLLFRTNRKVPDTPNTRGLMLLGWLVGTACALVAFFTPFGAPEANLLGHPAWKAFERSLFATGVAWVVYACCVGYGGIITEFLSWSGWLPLSRLTYTAYIIHPMIIQAYYMAYRGPRLYSSLTWWFMFVSFSFMSLVCGFAASMMAEAPFLELEKILLPNRRGREAKHETTAEDGHDSMAMKAVECDPEPPLPPHDGKGTSGPNGC
ncbi:uncharacterized protein LOC144878368 [Branchiostoma floridae x Branchiostoma japonicum]